jgi:hypothetical protein
VQKQYPICFSVSFFSLNHDGTVAELGFAALGVGGFVFQQPEQVRVIDVKADSTNLAVLIQGL